MHTILNKLETGNKLQDTDEVAESNIYAKPYICKAYPQNTLQTLSEYMLLPFNNQSFQMCNHTNMTNKA